MLDATTCAAAHRATFTGLPAARNRWEHARIIGLQRAADSVARWVAVRNRALPVLTEKTVCPPLVVTPSSPPHHPPPQEIYLAAPIH